MHIRQLLPILGICLSQVHAIIPPEPDQTTKSIVTLITAPHEALEANVPGLSSEQANRLRNSPWLYSKQLMAGLIETENSLLYIGTGPAKAHTPLIKKSLLGYSHTLVEDLPPEVRTKRLEIYRDSLYSRISDLAKQLGPDWTEDSKRGADAVKYLKADFLEAVLELEHVPLAPPGNHHARANRLIAAEQFLGTHCLDLLDKLYRRQSENTLPTNFNLPPMKYLDVQEVTAALQETNQGEYVKAFPVNFLLREHLAPARLSSDAAAA